ncbi:hypothetical protein Patl1_15801 [Pistacia atlantica]|uniref:Uncharacterized protein n=1 Tax=Pistacia atlantica TaxID=434234 RepID=A0ACC1B5G2_9ROSI|nr:hypothetical protein Patl1_15801 [Pistacia atlantica]
MSERYDCHSAKVYNGKEVRKKQDDGISKGSNWQIPNEVTKLRKKQDDGISKDHLMSLPSTNITIEEASAPTTLSAPAVNTGGRDATTLRTSGPGSSFALDLIKKKLQDSELLLLPQALVASRTDSEDEDSGPSKEECITKFKEMLKKRGVAPFSKWEKECQR